LDLADRYRGKIPLTVFGGERYETLSAVHLEQATVRLVQDIATEKATDEGVVNRYENQVMHTSTQGFVLFLMPYGNKLDTFPDEILELTHLNRLRAPGHGIEKLPDDIGQLSALEVLDLSGNRIIGVPGNIGQMTQLRKLDLANNRIERLPDEISRLQSLKSLSLKGNPISDQELSRIRRLLPNCKIKM
ncbi:MAG: leucine-rich repeat domain-containing protein, partial [Acidobacteriota bacterium]|nr:leucine-rich repeat domain-containing protein [Acidobacteriota bacterium]